MTIPASRLVALSFFQTGRAWSTNPVVLVLRVDRQYDCGTADPSNLGLRSVNASRKTVAAVALLGALSVLVILHEVGWVLIDIADVQTKAGWVDLPVADDEHYGEDWLCEEIKDTIEYSFRIGSDDVATLANTPGDWVAEPDNEGDNTAEHVDLVDIATEAAGMRTALPSEVPENVEHSGASEGEVSCMAVNILFCG